MYLDIHAHLTGEEYGAAGGLQGLIGRAKAAGVERIVACGYDVDSSFLSMRFSEAHEEIYFCAGFHPSELHKYKEGDFERLKALCAHEKCIGVGEIGLDYHFDDNPPAETPVRFRFLYEHSFAGILNRMELSSKGAACYPC